VIKLTMKFTGLFGRVKRGEGRAMANEAGRAAVTQAMTEWVTRRGDPSLSARMAPGAFSTYGMTKRSEKYTKEQRRANGVIQPYASPRRPNVQKLALIIARAEKTNPQQLLRALRELHRLHTTPMRQLVVRPGGYRIMVGGSNTVRARITLPGARILNKAGPKGEVYRRELLDFSKGAGRDSRWIWRRTHDLMFTNNFGSRGTTVGAFSGLRGLKSGMRRLGRG
jgi:hypothetical protein